ncbi:MAG: 3-isopropylmalate dehydratase large subunit [Chloroflexi bacterium]|nr:3-isopropylmalate dehydratase large subunit [Chloroflexota bacterium]
MPQTMVQKILAAHAGRERVEPGELVDVPVDVVLANDITAPIAIDAFNRLGAGEVFNADRIMLVPDHFAPNKDIKAAEQNRTLRLFTREQELTNKFVEGRAGIEHVMLPERGLVLPGDIVIGGDSHTCTYGALGALATGMGSTDIGVAMATGRTWMRVPETMRFVYRGELPRWVTGKDLILHTIGEIGSDGALYRAMEFGGEAITQLNMEQRLTITNMVIEAGGKCGFVEADAVTRAYVEERATRPYKVYHADEGAAYHALYEFDVSDMEPQIACPYSPANVKPLSQVKPVAVDQVFIGSCTNGRLSDLAVAADLLEGRPVAENVRCIVIPGSQRVFLDALKLGYLQTFTEAGCVVSTSTCGPCLGGYMGVLAAGEVCVSTSNRNFRGRMGHRDAQVYLANPAVAASSAILGRIGGPEEVA